MCVIGKEEQRLRCVQTQTKFTRLDFYKVINNAMMILFSYY